MKKLAVVPALLTLGNGVCGFGSITCASYLLTSDASPVLFTYSAGLIFLAMVFDALDGLAARLSKTASDFGGQLDSLCDAISFGLAPAYLLLRLVPTLANPMLQQLTALIAAIYMCCAIVRLARFNVENNPDPSSHKRFKGLPSPAAAGCVASLAILRGGLETHWSVFNSASVQACLSILAPLGTLFVAMLMVSRVPYPHLTSNLLGGRRPLKQLSQVIFTLMMLVILRELALVVAFWGYALAMCVRFVWVRSVQPQANPTAQLEKPIRR